MKLMNQKVSVCKGALDERSQKGQFGWFTLGNSPIPMIYRNGDEEYCSVRMAEQAGLNSVLKFLNRDICTCINVKSYHVTPCEGALLNNINFVHCDNQFGKDHFTNDLIVKVSDVQEFYNFLSTCHAKLTGRTISGDQRFGFVMINGTSVVPYSVSKGIKYVPLFYFEGALDQVTVKSHTLDGWDLSYLKFCCKLQGIRYQLYANETCAVIDLNDIKAYFPPDTTFEEYWVPNSMRINLVVPGKSSSNMGGWTKHPTSQFSPNNLSVKSEKNHVNTKSDSQVSS